MLKTRGAQPTAVRPHVAFDKIDAAVHMIM